MTLLSAILWPIVVLGIAAMGCHVFLQWLKRETVTVTLLKADITELAKEWTHKFDQSEQNHERRLGAVERTLNQLGSRNPLGSHYDTRRSG